MIPEHLHFAYWKRQYRLYDAVRSSRCSLGHIYYRGSDLCMLWSLNLVGRLPGSFLLSRRHSGASPFSLFHVSLHFLKMKFSVWHLLFYLIRGLNKSSSQPQAEVASIPEMPLAKQLSGGGGKWREVKETWEGNGRMNLSKTQSYTLMKTSSWNPLHCTCKLSKNDYKSKNVFSVVLEFCKVPCILDSGVGSIHILVVSLRCSDRCEEGCRHLQTELGLFLFSSNIPFLSWSFALWSRHMQKGSTLCPATPWNSLLLLLHSKCCSSPFDVPWWCPGEAPVQVPRGLPQTPG